MLGLLAYCLMLLLGSNSDLFERKTKTKQKTRTTKQETKRLDKGLDRVEKVFDVVTGKKRTSKATSSNDVRPSETPEKTLPKKEIIPPVKKSDIDMTEGAVADKRAADSPESTIPPGPARGTRPELLTNDNGAFRIQVGAFNTQEPDMRGYREITHLGRVYVEPNKNGSILYLGNMSTRDHAERLLETVQSKGFMDAFISERITKRASQSPESRFGSTPPDEMFTIRLGSFKAPPLRNLGGLNGIGQVYLQQNSNEMFTAILVGQSTADDTPSNALKFVRDKGFYDAMEVPSTFDTDQMMLVIDASGATYAARADGSGTITKTTPKSTAKENTVAERVKITPTTLSTTTASPDGYSVKGRYFIQLAAVSTPSPDVTSYDKLSGLGSVYSDYLPKKGITRVLLGGYTSEVAAERVLKQVKAKGIKNAYVHRGVYESKGKKLLIKKQ